MCKSRSPVVLAGPAHRCDQPSTQFRTSWHLSKSFTHAALPNNTADQKCIGIMLRDPKLLICLKTSLTTDGRCPPSYCRSNSICGLFSVLKFSIFMYSLLRQMIFSRICRPSQSRNDFSEQLLIISLVGRTSCTVRPFCFGRDKSVFTFKKVPFQ
jgi:hypothetical protein